MYARIRLLYPPLLSTTPYSSLSFTTPPLRFTTSVRRSTSKNDRRQDATDAPACTKLTYLPTYLSGTLPTLRYVTHLLVNAPSNASALPSLLYLAESTYIGRYLVSREGRVSHARAHAPGATLLASLPSSQPASQPPARLPLPRARAIHPMRYDGQDGVFVRRRARVDGGGASRRVVRGRCVGMRLATRSRVSKNM
ncbi:hypothetical protein BKA80DRAFT_1934 [Phyllosticta citrichinensis]